MDLELCCRPSGDYRRSKLICQTVWPNKEHRASRSFVVSCRVVSCRVVSCRVVSCRVVSCRCLVFSCLVLFCLAAPCLVLSCLVLSCLAEPYLVVSCLVLCLFLSGRVLSCLLRMEPATCAIVYGERCGRRCHGRGPSHTLGTSKVSRGKDSSKEN
jgi:hypothetical protein